MAKIRILIVDDHPLFRQGLRDVLETDPSLIVVGEAADGEDAIQQARHFRPDVILMDINLPTINGLQVTKKIKLKLPNTRVVMITGYDDSEQVYHALIAGASAYCSKDVPPESLVRTIYSVYSGKYVIDDKEMEYDQVVELLQSKIGRTDVDPLENKSDGKITLPATLSPREMEILELVTKGASNKEVARILGISHQTVKNHMTAILRKLRVEDRTQAAVYAIKRGWVQLQNKK